ncbi:nucleotide-binding protein [Rhodococcus opacus]|uniref:nucleotide-binding protein n=1 Tax=Rhodococcus opacus TaxID=37919 RepID=UPI002955CB02|nr:nucleotide-binding protein [Rhodococcus opacus]MDV7088674.1 nucleotide-binding protein [Rhodococcus opacus]
MKQERKLELLQQQIDAAQGGIPANFDEWRDKTGVVLRAVLGEEDPLCNKFDNVRYSLGAFTSGTPASAFSEAQIRGVTKGIAILEAAKTRVELSAESMSDLPVSPNAINRQSTSADSVFIVHGRNEAREQSVARTVTRLVGFEPVILHEQPNAGRTIIEKLEDSANAAGYAIVVATGDDVGKLAGDGTSEQPRARQNVIFELGYFVGKLGRHRVAFLFDPDLERPSDTDGILYIPLDTHGGWKAKLAGELEKAGFTVDWSKLGA